MTTEHQLIQRLQDRDPLAWRQVVSEFTPDLYNYLAYTIPATALVETVVAEIFQSSVAQMATLPQTLSLSTYLYSIAYHKVADFWRRPAMNDADRLWADVNRLGLPNELAGPFAELPEFAQQVLFLRYQVCLPVAMLAEILGRSFKATEPIPALTLRLGSGSLMPMRRRCMIQSLSCASKLTIRSCWSGGWCAGRASCMRCRKGWMCAWWRAKPTGKHKLSKIMQLIWPRLKHTWRRSASSTPIQKGTVQRWLPNIPSLTSKFIMNITTLDAHC